jgi:pimeloyl-ACP methyl ester carboxylesterase
MGSSSADPLPLVSNDGEQMVDVGRGIEICCETFGDRGDPPLLLVMGLAMQMVHWPEPLIARLVHRGHYVIRFDNRDRGRSTHTTVPTPSLIQLATRRFDPKQYTLDDMALDTGGLLDALALDSAHVVGVSMGGMIGQMLAADRPRKVRSLVSIMSSTGNRRVGQPRPSIYRVLLRGAPRERAAFVEHQLRVLEAIGAPGDAIDPTLGRTLVEAAYERDPDPRGTGRQLAAILASGDRTTALRTIAAPTLVIHGEQDPLIAPSGGRATAKAIPGARLLTIPDMGHSLPERLWPRLVDAIADHVAAAERARQVARAVG